MLSHSDTPTLTVTDFSVSATPPSVTVARGGGAEYMVTISPLGGSFDEEITMSCSGLPAQASCSFSPSTVTPGVDSPMLGLTVSTSDPDTPTGLTDFDIIGTAGPLVRSTPSMLIVSDFVVGVSPDSATVIRGKSTDYTVTVGAVGGTFNDDVVLSCGGLPAGAACSFSDSTVIPGNGSATSTMTISTTDPDTPTGGTDFTVNAVSGLLQSAASGTVIVSDFTVTVAPGNVAVTRGDSATYTVEIGPVGGDFGDGVSLSCADLPAQATCTFSDSVLTPGGATATSTLKVSTSAPGTPVGPAVFTVTGTSGTLEHGATATVDVTIDFTIAVSPSSRTVTAGQSASYTVTIGPLGYFNDEITLACGGLPAVASCSFSPAAVTPNDVDATSSLTISTTARAASFTSTLLRPGSGAGFWPLLLAIGRLGIGLTGLALRGRGSEKRRVRLKFALAAVVLAMTLVNACGESTAPEEPETFNITVTGTSGSIGHSAAITLVVR